MAAKKKSNKTEGKKKQSSNKKGHDLSPSEVSLIMTYLL